MKAENQQLDHLAALDGMRGALACLIMLMHFGMDRLISLASRGVIERCEWDLSVDFFFVLSGFVLARSFERKQPTLRKYLINRLLRLAPMFLLTLVIVLACGVTADGWTKTVNFLMVQSFFGFDSLNYPAWSIPFELFIPALGLLAVGHWRTWRKPLIDAVLVITLLGAVACAYDLAVGVDHRLARAFFGLALGMLLYRIGGQNLEALRATPLQIFSLFGAVLVTMLLAHRLPLAALLFHPLVIVVIVSGALARSVFSIAPLQALGRWSYSIYLLHIPVLMVTSSLLGNEAVDHNPVLKLVLAATTIMLASLCYRFIESPVLQLTKGRRRRALIGEH